MRELPRKGHFQGVVGGAGVAGEQSDRSVIAEASGVARGVLADLVVVVGVDARPVDAGIGFDKAR